MKILLIASHVPPMVGGAPVVYENICRYLKDEIVILAPWRYYLDGQEIKGWRESDLHQPFEVQRIELLQPLVESAPKNLFVSVLRLICEDFLLYRIVAKEVLRLIDTTGADIVCLGDLWGLSWLGEYLRRKRNIPIIHYIHGEEVTTSPDSFLYSISSKFALRRAEAVIAVSSFTRSELIRRRVKPERIHLITNGVNLERFSPGTKDPEILCRHGVEGKKVLLTIARVEERKGHDKVIEALPLILRATHNVVYLVVGRGGYLETLKTLVKDFGVEDKVVFVGHVPWEDLPRYYRSCDVFIMPNRFLPNGDTEGFGLVFLEANACGKPVIGGKAGGVPDAVADGETGILVDGNSVEDIAKAAIQLLSNKELAERMGQAGYKRAQNFSWANKAEEFRQLCMNLTNK
ncbi:MAG: glycosyltransferase family 4 protein [Deltaproteobacteria bacterium]|nr:glycosyltransferase family 4 protein [Deltaproteobacteria bacterium]